MELASTQLTSSSLPKNNSAYDTQQSEHCPKLCTSFKQVSPFNLSDVVSAEPFTREMMFYYYMKCEKNLALRIPEAIKEDIMRLSGGYPGLFLLYLIM